MIAQAEHIPVHLGAMPDAVAAVAAHDPAPGEVWILNDPYAGGTHLPDVTMVSRTALGFAVSRAHHADVGAVEPGSMPADSRTLDEEGVVIPPTRLDDETLAAPRRAHAQPGGAARRLPRSARRASPRRAARRRALRTPRARDRGRRDGRAVRVLGASRPRGARRHSPTAATRRRTCSKAIRGELVIRAAVTIAGDGIEIDFEGTAPQHDGNLNCPLAVARSASYFVVRCVTDPDLPASGGAFAPVTVQRARGLPRQRAPTRGRRGGERGDLEPDRRRPLRRARRRRSTSPPRARGR